jgi:hypothetical protein
MLLKGDAAKLEEYRLWGLTLEKYWTFLKAELSLSDDNPILEKSARFRWPLWSEGDNKRWDGVVLKLFSVLLW